MKTPALRAASTRGVTLVYGLLVSLTLMTWAVGVTGAQGLAVALMLLALALFKGFLVGDWFMGLRRVSGWWRWVILVWLLVPGSLIAVAFVLAARG